MERVGLNRIGIYRVVLGFIRFCWVILGFRWILLVGLSVFLGLPSFTLLDRVQLVFFFGVRGCERVGLNRIGIYRVVLGFIRFCWVILGFRWILLVGLSVFLGLLSFTWFYWVSLSLTGFD